MCEFNHFFVLSAPIYTVLSPYDMSQARTFLNTSRSVFTRYMNTISGDLPRSNLTLAPGSDFLLHNLKNAPSPNDVLRIVSEHHNIMNSRHIMQALRSLFDLQKCQNSAVSPNEILRHPDFNKLCKKLKVQAGVIEVNDTIEALKIISYVGVPANTKIVQVLLQLLRRNIDMLSLHHIMFLDYLVCRFKDTPLVQAFMMALPIAFEVNLPLKMDRSNLTHLTDYLYYAARVDLSSRSVDVIVQSLVALGEEFDARNAKSIIWSLSELEARDSFEPLMNKAIHDLLVHIDDLSYTDIESTLSKLVRKYSKRSPYCYNETFVDTCANYIIDHDLGFKHAVYTLRKLGRIHHVSKHLLDYVSKKALEDPACITNADAADIYSIVISLALTSYRPIHWDSLKDHIIKKKNLAAEDKKEIIWIRFAASLCLLDIYKIDVITKALHPEYLEVVFKKGFLSDYENFFAICQAILLNRPEFIDLFPPSFEPENVITRMRDIPELPLEASLQMGLGGERYVMSNLISKKGHQIDHAILFRKNGYPVAINKKVKFIEETDHPKNETLLVLALRPVNYTINTKELREATALSIKSLEADGYNVATVNLEVWKSLSDFEKIPYLMQAVKNKMNCEIDESVAKNN